MVTVIVDGGSGDGEVGPARPSTTLGWAGAGWWRDQCNSPEYVTTSLLHHSLLSMFLTSLLCSLFFSFTSVFSSCFLSSYL